MEQSLAVFLLSAVVISLSGVLLPGPMTAAVIQKGGREKLTGIYVSFGHGMVEVPIILLMYFGAASLFESEWTRFAIGIAGGIYLLYMAKDLLRPAENFKEIKQVNAPSSLRAGIVLSMGNPYFLIWWATVGLGLVLGAAGFGIKRLVLFIMVHWLCDLLWYSLLSLVSFKGVKVFGEGFYRKVSILCGLALLFFGGVFLYSSAKLIAG
jgi:threonine/homoserine/homoserine lactone efflux protein